MGAALMLSEALLACAMMVHPVTLNAVVGVESGGRPWAIHVNGINDNEQPHPTNLVDAAGAAQRFIAAGKSVDLGLSQVNSKNLSTLGLTVEQALEPCTNLHAGGTILATFYASAVTRYGSGQRALVAALSAYNSGDEWRGIRSGYVAKYYAVPPIELPRSTVIMVAINRHASDTEVW